MKGLIREYQKVTGREVKKDGGELISNSAILTDEAVINILDNILNLTASVYGPYGGYHIDYREKTAPHEQSVVTRSKDGNKFFTNLELLPTYSNSILQLIRQQTDYVSSYENKSTSKDGTTSTAVVSSAVTKMLLTNRRIGKFNIPTTISNMFFEIVKEVGTNLVNEFRVPIYDEMTKEFTENGRKRLIDAIETCVDRNPVFCKAFRSLLDESVSSKINMLDLFFEQPIEVQDDVDLDFIVKKGISTIITDYNKANLKTGVLNNQLIIIFDGFVEAGLQGSIFVRVLHNFIQFKLNEILNQHEDIEGVIFLFNRLPEHIVHSLKQMSSESKIKFRFSLNNRKTVSFRLLQIDDLDTKRAHFEDLMYILKDSVIDLNEFNSFIREEVNKIVKKEKDGAIKVTDEVLLKKLEEMFLINKTLDESIRLNENYNIFSNLFDSIENNVEKTVFDMSFDGYRIGITLRDQEQKDRVDERYKEITEELKLNMNAESFKDEIELRLRSVSSNRVIPVIKFKSFDDKTEMYSLLEDALGVFSSVIKFGVMGGGNTFFLKYGNELKSRCLEMFKSLQTGKLSNEKLNKYNEALGVLVDSIICGYKIAYIILLRGEDRNTVDNLIENVYPNTDNSTLVYNIITGGMDDTILEAARTTKDVLILSLEIAKTILNTRVFRIARQSEYSMSNAMDKIKLDHPINNLILNEEDK